ncbi:MAG: branched-chain amino acid ABC transporter permease [Thermomicrobiales bacterium]|nr:branched-chain amino acid ABC transporter permease [Thermomicrobiales bacterium]
MAQASTQTATREIARPAVDRRLLIGLIVAAAAALVLPIALPNPYLIHVANLTLYYMIAAVSLDVVAGFLGELSFGHAGFLAIGAYATAILTMHALPNAWYSFWIALIIGGLLAAVAGVAVGVPALRIRGDYFFVVTMGFGEIVRFVLLNWTDVTGGAFGLTGIPTPAIGSYTIIERSQFYYVFLVALVLTLIPIVFLRRSYAGRSWIAIREDPVAAEAMGIPLTYFKVQAFAVSAFFAGIAGGLLASYLAYLHPSNFLALESIMILVMVLLGGRGLLYGALAGAILITALGEVLRPVAEYRMLIIGALMAALMIFKPRGLLGK